MQIKQLKTATLVPYENNPRINDQAVEAVANSISAFGFINPIVTDGDLVVVAGHTRLKAAQRLGLEKVPVIIADYLTEEQAAAFRLADNKTAELAEWDEEALLAEIAALGNIDLSLFGFDAEQIEPADGEVFSDDYEEPAAPPAETQRGDIYKLGAHRLICGDATEPETIALLMANEAADLLQTDPPYNVDYSAKNEVLILSDKGNRIQTPIENDNMTAEAFGAFLAAAFTNAAEAMRPGAAFYVWHASAKQRDTEDALNAAGLEVRQQLVWVKNIHVLGLQDYQQKHEPCFYGWKDGAAHYFTNSRSETTVTEDAPDLNKITKAEAIELLRQIYEKEPATVIEEKKPAASKLHPTMKPLPLIGYQIANSTKRGQIVLDIFAGSGSTMMAAEQLGRRCYCVELDPHYCDVIKDRWEKLTGGKAEKI